MKFKTHSPSSDSSALMSARLNSDSCLLPMLCVGLNHNLTSVDIREKYYLQPREQELLLLELKQHDAINASFVLSTCNRTEIYVERATESSLEDVEHHVLHLLGKVKRTNVFLQDRPHFYTFHNWKAAKHLFEVACSLDSLVIGEKQILGQVKQAIQKAQEARAMSACFNVLAQLVLNCAKKAHTETRIAYGGTSVSWAAMAMAEQHLGSLAGRRAVIVGSGKMSELAGQYLQKKNLADIAVLNRTREKAQDLAQRLGARAFSIRHLAKILSDADFCICAVGAPHFIMGLEEMEECAELQGSDFSKLLIDISVPRNIDPAVAQFPGVELLTIDDLKSVVRRNIQRRQAAVQEVLHIIDHKLLSLQAKLSKRNALTD